MQPNMQQPPNMQQQPQQPALYDSVNCDYEPAGNYQQNFGNPYDCPEGMYGGSMVSSVGYSKVKFTQNSAFHQVEIWLCKLWSEITLILLKKEVLIKVLIRNCIVLYLPIFWKTIEKYLLVKKFCIKNCQNLLFESKKHSNLAKKTLNSESQLLFGGFFCLGIWPHGSTIPRSCFR